MFYNIPRFSYHKPSNLDEALELLDRLGDAKIIAGGTDLLIDLRIGRYSPRNIIDINRVKELKYIVDEGEYIRIGALTRLQEIIESKVIKEKIPLLHEAVYQMASWQIRSRGTIGGNLCNASPAADTAPPLLVLEAKLKLVSIDGERIVDIRDFFKGPRETVLRHNELLKEIIVPVYHGYGYSYLKLGRRNSFTLSIVSVATMVRVEDGVFSDVRIALGSVAPTPVRAHSVEKYLKDRGVSMEVIREGVELVVNDISPITDVRASAEYRRSMSIVLTYDSIVTSLKRIGIEVGGG